VVRIGVGIEVESVSLQLAPERLGQIDLSAAVSVIQYQSKM